MVFRDKTITVMATPKYVTHVRCCRGANFQITKKIEFIIFSMNLKSNNLIDCMLDVFAVLKLYPFENKSKCLISEDTICI
jgi:hypothetical protein